MTDHGYKPKENNKLSENRKQLVATLARGGRSGLVSVERAGHLLHLPPTMTRRRLATLAQEGWLARVRRGLYLVLPLEASAHGLATPEDPWVLAREVFAPCYIGGWSAAEHWGLTEQLFRSTFVVTVANIRTRSTELLGAEFTLVRVSPARLTHTTLVWRGPERVPASDRERTIVDALVDPAWVGGVRHLADILTTYRENGEANLPKLIRTLESSGRGAAWKRFGYLAGLLWPDAMRAVAKANRRLTTGVIKLDPAVTSRGKLDRRWGLWVNVGLSRETRRP